MNRFVKCPSCKVNIPKQDVVEKDGQAICTVCKKSFSAELLSATPVPVAAPKTTTKRRWIELKSKRGKTYYHNNETGEDRWDMPPDFDVVATVAAGAESAPPAMVNFKADDPVRNAIMLQQNKQDARKQGLPEDMIEALAAQQAAQQASNSLHEAIAAMEKQSKQAKQQQLQTKSQPESPRAAPSSSSVAESTPDTQEAQSSGSSCTLM
ncbi:hypothetical protein LEN26_017502 [Aphanomyces euteiches]|nr:hypothetical protein LEN26_017502 [Aphanomyces euteiches]KAH9111327.1 hypothetical protein AeMF1_014124 [Aphanomyces euteiches]KAH9182798.1 hypothetical protein AeNC1_015227 [Aphanomyces euteiches]